MKKIISVILVVFTMVVSTTALSKEAFTDFSSYTVDELISIRDTINRELQNRIGANNPDMIYRGSYDVGDDIKPGEYLFTCTEAKLIGDDYWGNILSIKTMTMAHPLWRKSIVISALTL